MTWNDEAAIANLARAVYGHTDHSRFEARFDQVTQPASRRLNMKMKAGRDNFSACFAASARPAQWNRIVLVGVVTLLLVGHAHAQAPSIASITPNTGGVGEYMAISGSNFGATQGTSTVTFNGTPATVVNTWSNTHIATYVPSGATTGHIVVTVGGVSSATTPYDVFTVITTPYISGLAGNSGPVGSVFTVNGSNFGASQGTSTLTINGTPVTQYHYWTNNQIGAAVVPSGATTGYVVVTVNGASSPTNQYVIYTVTPTVYYYFDDALGSSRVVTNSSGTICYDADFYPFGGERAYTNTCAQNYKFTGKERDSESGLNNFGARYMSSQYGRFMSPDPSNQSVDFELPQTWNRYSYVLNNALNMVDRNGQWPTYTHTEIINEAFPGMSASDLKILNDASKEADTHQESYNSWMHGMSDGTDPNTAEAIYVAMQLGDQQITKDEAQARVEQAKWIAEGHTGISPAALQKFGNALHIITDRLSPAHAGYQPWYGQSKWNPSAWWHFLRESNPRDPNVNTAVQAGQAAFQQTFGDEFDWMMLGSQQQQEQVTHQVCSYDDDGNIIGCH